MVTYDININNGDTIYSEGSNVSIIEITNSDEQYYQTGFVELFDVDDIHSVNDSIKVFFDNKLTFTGYITRKESGIEHGKNFTRYQLIGETYDLWRYHTDDYALYSGTTSYIASSLISSYCENIRFYNYDPNAGYNVINDIDLTNISVGDAIARLTELDGYSFFVESGQVHYYKPNIDGLADFNITEADIIESDFIGESDEDIVNDVLVLGGTGYSNMTQVSQNAPSSAIFLKENSDQGILVAQRFTAEDNILSSVDLYLNRTKGNNQPEDNLEFEIWENTEKTVFNDDFDNWNYLNASCNSGMGISGSYLIIEDFYTPSSLGCLLEGSGFSDYTNYIYGSKFTVNQNMVAYKILANVFNHLSTPSAKCAIYDHFTSGLIASSNTVALSVIYPHTFTLKTYPTLVAGNTYKLLVWLFSDTGIFRRTADGAGKGYYKSISPGVWPDTLTGLSSDSNEYSIYAKCSSSISNSIESVCFSGQYTDEHSGYDCKYMRIDLTGVTSSQHIFISGTNDSGATWKTLIDGEWIDFDEEDHSVKIKYKFSSNGAFTPKIDSCKLSIADDSSNFENIIYSDTFDNWSKLSGTSMISCQLVDGYLQISGTTATSYVYADSATNIACKGTWYYYPYCYDKNEGTRAETNWSIEYMSSTDEFTYNTPINLANLFWFEGWDQATQGEEICYITSVYASGLYDSDWVLVRDADHRLQNWGGATDFDFTSDQPNPYKVGIKKIKYSWIGASDDQTKSNRLFLYETKTNSFTKISWSGSIKISSCTSPITIEYLKPVLTGYDLDFVTLSGTCDSGLHWTKLYNNQQTEIADSGKVISLAFYLKPFLSGNSIPNTPKIASATLTAYGVAAGGNPKSGSKIEWSDDIDFRTSDIPYPPSSTGWKTYTSPKLALTEDENYWMVFEHISSNNQYWTYYYDPNSSYDGRIMLSWNGGYTWSSNTIDPIQVPGGNMRFKLGWTEGDIQATATNQDSIDLYGRHFKRIDDSSITTLEQAQTRADLEVSGMTSIPKTGRFVINGRTNISTEYVFSANISTVGFNEKLDIKSYTHRIDNNGFTTEITYGKHEFDVAKKIAQLEHEMGL